MPKTLLTPAFVKVATVVAISGYTSAVAIAAAVHSFILNLRAEVNAIKTGKYWKKPSPAAFKIT